MKRRSGNKCYETTGEISDLIEQAEECVQYLQEDSVGYYFYSMLLALKKLNGDNKIVELKKP